jgi:hypothetical protein
MNFGTDLIKLLPLKFQRVTAWQELMQSFGEVLDGVHLKLDGLADLVDPDSVPLAYMQYYARNQGLEIPLSAEGIATSESRQREFLRSLVEIIKQKGLADLMVDLADFLYLADYASLDLSVYELWTNDYLSFTVDSLQITSTPAGWTGDGVTKTFTVTVGTIPVRVRSMYATSTAADGTSIEARDNQSGDGTLDGNVTAGSINYTTGAISITFSKAPRLGASVVLKYTVEDDQYLSPHFLMSFPVNVYLVLGETSVSVNPTGWVGDGTTTNFTTTLTRAPVKRSSLTITAMDVFGVTMTVIDDGLGNLIGDVGSGNNTIDYETGEIDVTFEVPVIAGGLITVAYTWQDRYTGRQKFDRMIDYLDRYRPVHTVKHVEIGRNTDFWRVGSSRWRVGDYDDTDPLAPALDTIIRIGGDFGV